jgi:hypothetical protein
MSRAISPAKLRKKAIIALESSMQLAIQAGDYQTATRISESLIKLATQIAASQFRGQSRTRKTEKDRGQDGSSTVRPAVIIESEGT